jgi:hypothetical protein
MSSIGLGTNSNYGWGWDVRHDQSLDDLVYTPILDVCHAAAGTLKLQCGDPPWRR